MYIKCEPSLTNEYINIILGYLLGWELKDPNSDEIQDEYSTSFLEHNEIEDALSTTQTISKEEIELFFERAKNEVKAYIWFEYIPKVYPVHEAICKWTAGLIWKKYNVKEVELMDRTNQLGYGDQLIIQAQNELKPYIRTRLRSLF
ncbi:hypothetical protein [Methanosphaera sp.]|jgi:hypothetical protein|uniref:hypothetical protein n=1 Tax=Methanosphaera sp. TaxID=2666342 RepID=UPI003D905882